MAVFRRNETGLHCNIQPPPGCNKELSLKGKGAFVAMPVTDDSGTTLKGLSFIKLEKKDAIRAVYIRKLNAPGWVSSRLVSDERTLCRGATMIYSSSCSRLRRILIWLFEIQYWITIQTQGKLQH